ncbi:hypothetical protein L596_005015 [Steinernema carpocapsae]|uniref:Uncharacterized protein n=1 Tax=Steinernema carpocapsae TaxID=34508 RepID=A0A4U8UZ79_STECR|nr:hypothetical protein L596_005015 [Steinernema carpocapsae]
MAPISASESCTRKRRVSTPKLDLVTSETRSNARSITRPSGLQCPKDLKKHSLQARQTQKNAEEDCHRVATTLRQIRQLTKGSTGKDEESEKGLQGSVFLVFMKKKT